MVKEVILKLTTKLWIGLGILAVLAPLGLLIPGYFKSGGAWGEWGTGEIQKLVGYIPEKLAKLSGLWEAPLPDYSVKGLENKGVFGLSLAYILSAVMGIAVTAAAAVLIGKLLEKKDK